MNPVLQIFLISCVVIFIAVIIWFLTKKRLNLKYSLTWLAAAAVMLILAIFPSLVEKLGSIVGIASVTSTVFIFAVLFMMIIIFTLTMIVSHLNNRIYRLTQTQALLEKRVRELENKDTLSGRE